MWSLFSCVIVLLHDFGVSILSSFLPSINYWAFYYCLFLCGSKTPIVFSMLNFTFCSVRTRYLFIFDVNNIKFNMYVVWMTGRSMTNLLNNLSTVVPYFSFNLFLYENSFKKYQIKRASNSNYTNNAFLLTRIALLGPL